MALLVVQLATELAMVLLLHPGVAQSVKRIALQLAVSNVKISVPQVVKQLAPDVVTVVPGGVVADALVFAPLLAVVVMVALVAIRVAPDVVLDALWDAPLGVAPLVVVAVRDAVLLAVVATVLVLVAVGVVVAVLIAAVLVSVAVELVLEIVIPLAPTDAEVDAREALLGHVLVAPELVPQTVTADAKILAPPLVPLLASQLAPGSV